MGILWDMYRSGISSEDSRKMLCNISKVGLIFAEKASISSDSLLGIAVSAVCDKYGIPSGDWLFSVRFKSTTKEHIRKVCYNSVKGTYSVCGTEDKYTDILLSMRGELYNTIKMISTYKVKLYALVVKLKNCKSNIGIVTLRNDKLGIVYEGTDLPCRDAKYHVKSWDLSDLSEYDCSMVVSL